jgi:hypothetical protein
MDEIQLEIREPGEISRYTDEHFMNKLNEELEKVRKGGMKRLVENSNSPVSMSNHNSDSEGEEEEYDNFETDVLLNSPKNGLRKLTFREVRDSINKYYETDDKYSSELDILSTYLKGQKQMFSKSADIIQTKIMFLLVPAGIGSAIISIITPTIGAYKWSDSFISGLNAVVFVLFFLVYYLQWCSSALVYNQLKSQYERLEHSLDINKLMETSTDKYTLVLEILKDVERKLTDLKETTIIGFPYEIKCMFPILYHVHIFTFIKRIEVYKKNLIIKFKDIKNEIRYIEWKWGDKMEQKERSRFDFLCKIKEKIKNEILHYRNAYGSMEELMTKEIKRAEQIGYYFYGFSSLSKRINTDNPVVALYFSAIFEDD